MGCRSVRGVDVPTGRKFNAVTVFQRGRKGSPGTVETDFPINDSSGLASVTEVPCVYHRKQVYKVRKF